MKRILIITTLVFFSFSIAKTDTEGLIKHVKQSIDNAIQGNSKLTEGILKIQGYSSAKVRHFLNNICSLPDTRYLEIGVWKGSTFVSALYGNSKTIQEAVGIDNWSLFGGPSNEFHANCKAFLSNNSYTFSDHDCFSIDTSMLFKKPVTIYFYDGEHYPIDQERAFTYYNDILDDVFIAIIDDWDAQQVQDGTRTAFEKLHYKILYEIALPARYNGDVETWWHGLYVAVIQK